MSDFTATELAGVSTQLRSLRTSRKARRRFRLLEVICTSCHKRVAEVVNTSPRPAIVFRDRTRTECFLALDTSRIAFSPACHCSRASANYLEVRLLALAVAAGEGKLTLDRSTTGPVQ